MATVYGPPEGFDPPDFEDFLTDGRYDREADDKATAEYIARLTAEARARGNAGDLVGRVISFPIADGAAQYLVWKERPLELVHLPLGDAWAIPAAHARGIKLADVRQQVDHADRLAKLFAGNDAWWDGQAIGTVLHYDNGFEQYVRGEVVEVDGKKVLRPTALVGNVIPSDATPEQRKQQGWNARDIVNRMAWGKVEYGYHARKVLEGTAWRPSDSCVVESPSYNAGRRKVDPRGMEAIDFDSLLPTPDAELLDCEAKNRLLGEVSSLCNRIATPDMTDDERIAAIRNLVSS